MKDEVLMLHRISKQKSIILNNARSVDNEWVIKRRALICCILLFILFMVSCMVLYFMDHSETENYYAHIYQNGNLIKTIDLSAVSQDYTFTVTSDEDAFNIIEIHDKKIHIIDSNCPDSVCIHMGYHNNSIPITCLPNRLLITVTSQPDAENTENDIDIIVY